MKLAIGTAQFGCDYGIANQHGCVSENEVRNILNYAENNNISMLDTAIAYGESESKLGKLGVNDWNIVTKITILNNREKDKIVSVKEQVNASLKRLKVDKLYGVLLHNPECLLENNGDEIYSIMNELKASGIVENIGISIYSPLELDELCGRYEFGIIQAPINIFDRRIIESDWHQCLHKKGIELHARSVFLQGLLLMTAEKRPRIFNKWSSLWSIWDEWVKNNELTYLQACLRYVFSITSVKKIVIGVDSCQQLKEIIDAIDGELPAIPNELKCDDAALLNPSFWEHL